MMLPICEQPAKQFCNTCRDRFGGEDFRALVLAEYGEDITVCPLGIEMVDDTRGFGDTIAKITGKIGIRKCGGCGRRQAKLNKLVPYRKNG